MKFYFNLINCIHTDTQKHTVEFGSPLQEKNHSKKKFLNFKTKLFPLTIRISFDKKKLISTFMLSS